MLFLRHRSGGFVQMSQYQGFDTEVRQLEVIIQVREVEYL